MKKFALIFIIFIIAVGAVLGGCAKAPEQNEPVTTEILIEPQIAQMKSICELAVTECYYHNVAKFFEEDAEGILFWKKDKHFWIEYSGIVKFGIDISLVNIEVDGKNITITLPEATVQGCKVDSSSLNKNSYIIDKNSAEITAEDEVKAFEEAQKRLEETASNDRALLTEARQRAQKLLEDYITNIGNAVGRTYTVKWIYTDAAGKLTGETDETTTAVTTAADDGGAATGAE